MRERFINFKPGWVLRGGVVLGLFAFSLGCAQRVSVPENVALDTTTVPIKEYVGRNRLIMARSWCEGREPVVEVRVWVQKLSNSSGVNLLVARKGATNSRVLGVVEQDNPLGNEGGEFTRQFRNVYKPDALYNVGVPDFPVRERESIVMSVYRAELHIEKNRRVPKFKEQLDEVKASITFCSGLK